MSAEMGKSRHVMNDVMNDNMVAFKKNEHLIFYECHVR